MKKLYTTMALLFGMIMFAQDGTLDATFGISGVKNFINLILPKQLDFQPDGKMIVYGLKTISGTSYPCILRMNADGSLDNTFGTAGIATFTSYPCNVGNFEIESTGKILISLCGDLLRLNTDGTRDVNFNNGNDGGFVYDADFVKIMSDQKIIVIDVYTPELRIRRLNQNGTNDLTFNGGNYNSMNGGSGTSCIGVNILDNAKIVVSAKGYNGDYYNTRFNSNGSYDIDYVGTGNAADAQQGMSINNNLYLAIQYGFSSYFSVFKYNLLGDLDTTYDTDGIAQTDFNGNTFNISYNLNIQPNNKIIVVGKTGSFTESSVGLVRFNTNGSLDTTFGTLGKTITPTNSLSTVKTLSALSPIDGKLTVIGQNNTIGNPTSQDIMIARYTTGINLSNENFSNNVFKLFPNPTSNILKIETSETINDIKIIDLAGRTTAVSNFENNKIDVSNLSNGIYFIKIKTNNGDFEQKFIKN